MSTAPVAQPPGKLTCELAEQAANTWGFNCGPAAVCAVTGMSPDELRPHCKTFEAKGFTHMPTMCEILTSLRTAGKLRYQVFTKGDNHEIDWPLFGIARIQWEGSWLDPGVPFKARYHYTHWVASALIDKGRVVFDVNALQNGCGWISEKDWAETLVPWILETAVKRATGWHLTHAIEVRR